MAKSSKVTNKLLQQLDSLDNKKKKVYITTKLGEHEVLLSEYFGEKSINKVVSDLLEVITPLLQSEEIKPEDLVSPITLIPILTLREFTDLPIPKENDLAVLTAVSDRLINHGIVRQVYPQFDQFEVQKLGELIGESFKNLPQIQRTMQEMYAKLYLQEASKEEVEVNEQTV